MTTAGANEISFSGKTLSLGDSKLKVTEALSTEYTLFATNKEDTFLILPAGFGGTAGVVTFVNDNLKYAGLERLDRDEARTAGEALNLLTKFLKENAEKSKSEMSVSVNSFGDERIKNTFLNFSFAGRKVSVAIQENIETGKEKIGITEAIELVNN